MRKGWILLVVGSLLAGVGLCGFFALIHGQSPRDKRNTFFPVIALLTGLGLAGAGVTTTAEARAICRERALRADKNRRRRR